MLDGRWKIDSKVHRGLNVQSLNTVNSNLKDVTDERIEMRVFHDGFVHDQETNYADSDMCEERSVYKRGR